MTSGEMKFHLRCEALLNCVPEPGFRQLVVETILILILCVEHGVVPFLGSIINIDDVVREANKIFLEDMRLRGGLCCSEGADQVTTTFSRLYLHCEISLALILCAVWRGDGCVCPLLRQRAQRPLRHDDLPGAGGLQRPQHRARLRQHRLQRHVTSRRVQISSSFYTVNDQKYQNIYLNTIRLFLFALTLIVHHNQYLVSILVRDL